MLEMRLLTVGLDESFILSHFLDEAENEKDALHMLSIHEYDACIAHPMTVGKNFPHHVRERKITVPLIMLDPFGDVTFRVQMLNCGADRVLKVPIFDEELEAYLQALVRRCNGNHIGHTFEIGGITLDTKNHQASVNGGFVRITVMEYTMLEILASSPNRIFSKEALMLRMYGGKDEPKVSIVGMLVFLLRKKLRPHLGTKNGGIITHWGEGLQIDARKTS